MLPKQISNSSDTNEAVSRDGSAAGDFLWGVIINVFKVRRSVLAVWAIDSFAMPQPQGHHAAAKTKVISPYLIQIKFPNRLVGAASFDVVKKLTIKIIHPQRCTIADHDQFAAGSSQSHVHASTVR